MKSHTNEGLLYQFIIKKHDFGCQIILVIFQLFSLHLNFFIRKSLWLSSQKKFSYFHIISGLELIINTI